MTTGFSGPWAGFWGGVVLTLLHSLWQATAVAGVLWMLLRLPAARTAHVRYGLCLAALLAVALMPAATWSVLHLPDESPHHAAATQHTAALPGSDAAPASTSPRGADIRDAGVRATGGDGLTATSPTASTAGSGFFSRHLDRLIVIAWTLGVGAMLMWNITRLLSAGRLRRSALPVDDPALLALLRRLQTTLGVRRPVALLSLADFAGPAIVGILRPALLMPLSIVTELSAEDIEAVLAHELAHIRRHDYLVNVAQLLLESLLFFNPFVWWISRQTRLEREACCDALAVYATGRSVDYAELLVRWAERRPDAPALAVAAFATGGRNHLLERMRRLLVPQYQPSTGLTPAGALLMLLISVITGGCLWQGTQSAVVLAARLLTPHERAERLEALASEHSAAILASRLAAPRTAIEGTLRGSDGVGLRGPIYVRVAGVASPTQVLGETAADEVAFRAAARVGVARLLVTGPHIAPQLSAPINLLPDQVHTGLALTLTSGRSLTLRVIDEHRRPVIGGTAVLRPAAGGDEDALRLTTDERGEAVLERIGEVPYAVTVTREGYEPHHEVSLALPESGALTIMLTKGPSIFGTVHSPAGEPIASARVRLEAWYDAAVGVWHTPPSTPQTLTDAAGGFSIPDVRRGEIYKLMITAPGYGAAYHTVKGGERALRVSLQAPRDLRGKIIGGLERLPQERGQRVLPYRIALWDGWADRAGKAIVVREDGVARFTIPDVLPTRLKIPLAGMQVDLSRGMPEEIVVDLSEPPAAAAQRAVVLRLQMPPDLPPAHGSLRIVIYPHDRTRVSEEMHVAIENNEAHFRAPPDAEIEWKSADLRGYWLKRGQAQVTPGDDPLFIDLHVEPAGMITGLVPMPSIGGALPESGLVMVFDACAQCPGPIEPPLPARTDAQRRVVISPLPFGHTFGVYYVLHRKGYAVAARPMRIDAATPIHEAVFDAHPGERRIVRVVEEGGRPVAAEVKVLFDPHDQTQVIGRNATDAAGEAEFFLNPNLKNLRLGITARHSFQAMEVAVGAEQVTTVVLRPGHQLEGIILDDRTGEPLTDLRVTATPIAGDTRHQPSGGATITDHRGRFHLTTLSDHPMRLSFWRSDAQWSGTSWGPYRPADSPITLRLPQPPAPEPSLGRSRRVR